MIVLLFELQFVVQDFYDLVNVEGELLFVVVKMCLGIDEECDEDGFIDNEYVFIDIVYQLVQVLVFGCFIYLVSELLLYDVLVFGEKVNREVWVYYFYIGNVDVKCFLVLEVIGYLQFLYNLFYFFLLNLFFWREFFFLGKLFLVIIEEIFMLCFYGFDLKVIVMEFIMIDKFVVLVKDYGVYLMVDGGE